MRHVRGADVVAGEEDLRRFARCVRLNVVERVGQHLDRCASTEVRAADADHDQHFGIGLDLRCRLLDAREFFLVIVRREIDPAEVVGACARTVLQLLVSELHLACEIVNFMLADERQCFAVIKMNRFAHLELPPYK
ncbi:hypothetical protein D3C84_876740 [compost metagenome]